VDHRLFQAAGRQVDQERNQGVTGRLSLENYGSPCRNVDRLAAIKKAIFLYGCLFVAIFLHGNIAGVCKPTLNGQLRLQPTREGGPSGLISGLTAYIDQGRRGGRQRAMDNNVILQVRNIEKSFPGVKALDRINFSVKRGTVHALCGENGAGSPR